MAYEDLLPSLIANQLVVVTLGKIYQPPFPKWYNPNANCTYHGGTPGHSVEQCMALKHKVQSLIEAGWLTFQEDGPYIKINPLANHGGAAVNAIEVCGHEKDSCLMHPGVPHDMEMCSAVGNLLQQMIDQGRLEVSNEEEEEQHICMQSTNKESPKKHKPLVIHFTRDTSPQRLRHPSEVSGVRLVPFPYKSSHAVPWKYAPPGDRMEEATDIGSLSAKVTNIIGLSGINRSGRVFAPPDLPAQPTNAKGKAKVIEGQSIKAIPAPDEDVPTGGFAEGKEGRGKKEVSLEEASEFLRIFQQSKFEVIKQLNKTPTRVSLLELLMSSEPHRALLVKVLNEAHMAQGIFVEGFEGIANNITANNYLTFAKEEILADGRGHNRALNVSVKCMEHIMAKVLIDNGSSLNVMPKSMLEKLSFNASNLMPSSMVVRAFNDSR
ncbi:uncharacterized protein [Glycine max]|uniref:uncharacterized protein n=1 Tax=Glycine max TaxID=3847 RepID=UPI0003DE7D24|nr:uncharacterized protein LOC113001876 [Glycine max]|eukprot:XP_025984532.1 uncharacterized protein LOC113001876 [Glycine max]